MARVFGKTRVLASLASLKAPAFTRDGQRIDGYWIGELDEELVYFIDASNAQDALLGGFYLNRNKEGRQSEETRVDFRKGDDLKKVWSQFIQKCIKYISSERVYAPVKAFNETDEQFKKRIAEYNKKYK